MKTRSVAKEYPIVCGGGSAGGLDAYTFLLKHLPTEGLDSEPNHVFIMTGKHLHVLDGEFRLEPISKPRYGPT